MANALDGSHRLASFKQSPFGAAGGAGRYDSPQERRRRAALEVRRKRRQASYAAARADSDAIQNLSLSDREQEGDDEKQNIAFDDAEVEEYHPPTPALHRRTKATRQTTQHTSRYANCLLHAEVLESIPADIEEDWIALPLVPEGRRVLAVVYDHPRYRERRMTLYSRRRGQAINPASHGSSRPDAREDAVNVEQSEESSLADDSAAGTFVSQVEDTATHFEQADHALPTSFAHGPASQNPQLSKSQRNRRRRNKRRDDQPNGSDFSFPVPHGIPSGTQLDCIFPPRSPVLWALDLRCWGTTDMRDCDAQFRFYWLQARLSELSNAILPNPFPVPPSVSSDEKVMDLGHQPWLYPFIVKVVPTMTAPIKLKSWFDIVQAQAISAAESSGSTSLDAPLRGTDLLVQGMKRTKITIVRPTTDGAGEQRMDVDNSDTSSPLSHSTIRTYDALLPESAVQPDGILLYHREGSYIDGSHGRAERSVQGSDMAGSLQPKNAEGGDAHATMEEEQSYATPLACWVPPDRWRLSKGGQKGMSLAQLGQELLRHSQRQDTSCMD